MQCFVTFMPEMFKLWGEGWRGRSGAEILCEVIETSAGSVEVYHGLKVIA